MPDAVPDTVPDTAPSAAPDAARRAPRLSPRTRRALAIGAWLVATGLAALAVRAVGGRAALDAMRTAHAGWLVAAVVCHAGVIALWALQTGLLLPRAAPAARRDVTSAATAAATATTRPPYRRLLEVQALAAMAANTVPAFLGSVGGIALLAERGGVGAAAALAVFAQHNLAEGVAKLATLAVAARVAPLPEWMARAVGALGWSVAGLALALAALMAWGRRDAAGPPAASGDAPRPSLTARLRRTARALDALRSPRFAAAVLVGLAMKGAEAAGWRAVELALGAQPRPGSPVLALAATNLASALPVSPGNVGVYEAAAYGAYHGLLGVAAPTAVALGVLGHATYLAAFVGLGWGWLTARAVRGR